MKGIIRSARLRYSLVGLVLSLGAPLGWLMIRWFQGVGPTAEVLDNPLLIAYLALPTMVVFVIAGFALGSQWERLCLANDRLNELAVPDALTGLLNTRRFWQDIQRECVRAQRRGRQIHVLVLDLDYFKRINDTYGHLVGDEILKAAAAAMAAVMRNDEELYRVGGEEFAAIVVDATPEQALAVAERLRLAVAAVKHTVPSAQGTEELTVTISIGVAGRNGSSSPNPQALYARADRALYAAKEAGRNRVHLAPEADASAPAQPIRVL